MNYSVDLKKVKIPHPRPSAEIRSLNNPVDLCCADSNDWSTAQFDEDSVASRAITRFEYDATTNNLITIIKPLTNQINIFYGESWKSSYITRDYKELDNNIEGNTQYVVTSYDYDIKGRLVTKTVRFKTDTNDDDSNLYSYGSNAQKSMSQYAYDGMDRLLTKSIGDGATQTPVLKRQYFDVGNGTPEDPENPYTIDTNYLGFRIKSYYDSRYRLISVEKFKPNQDTGGDLDYSSDWEVKISWEWNVYAPGIEKIAQAIKYTHPEEENNQAFITKNTWDSIGRLTRVEVKNTDPAYQGDSVFKTIQEIEYDETVNAVVTKKFIDDTSGNFIQARVENDWLGRGPAKEITWTGLNGTGLQRVTVNHYRHDGKLVKKDLPNKQTYLYSYDNLGKLEKITCPDGTRTTLLYDLNGNLVQSIDRRNLSTTMTYNKSDLIVNKTTIDAERGDMVITTTYTQFGPAQIAQTENEDPIVENDYWYHWSGGVIKQQQIIDSHTMQVDNTFDAAGNQITTTPTGSGDSPWTKTFNIVPQFHPGGSDTDNFNRIAIADGTTNVITYEPDFLGLLTNIKYGDYASPTGIMSYTYDRLLRVMTLKSNEATPFLDITLTRDFLGNITHRQEPAQSPAPAIDYEYAFDGMNRLSSGENESETYDELSNLTTRGTSRYTYQDPDENGDQMRLASFDNGTKYDYTYDANGNPINVSNKFSSLEYDNLNSLRQIVHSQTDDYWYNSAGLRVKKTDDSAGTPKTTYTLFDGVNPLMQEIYEASAIKQTTFNIIVNGLILAQYKTVFPSATTSVVYFYLDYLNSRRVVVNSSGTSINRYRYSAWGNATQDVGSDDYRSFTSKDYDATGLIYFNARYYDPMTGRFLTEDPSRKGIGWYGYCGNNPLINVDPNGMWNTTKYEAGKTATTKSDFYTSNEQYKSGNYHQSTNISKEKILEMNYSVGNINNPDKSIKDSVVWHARGGEASLNASAVVIEGEEVMLGIANVIFENSETKMEYMRGYAFCVKEQAGLNLSLNYMAQDFYATASFERGTSPIDVTDSWSKYFDVFSGGISIPFLGVGGAYFKSSENGPWSGFSYNYNLGFSLAPVQATESKVYYSPITDVLSRSGEIYKSKLDFE